MTRFAIKQKWRLLTDVQQRAAVKAYLMIHPEISTSDEWWLFLARLFEMRKLEPGCLGLENIVH